jgi:hypothetical protein
MWFCKISVIKDIKVTLVTHSLQVSRRHVTVSSQDNQLRAGPGAESAKDSSWIK